MIAGNMAGATMTPRKALLVACAVMALAGCTTAEQVPQWSGRPQYYYEPAPYADLGQTPTPYYYTPVRPRRSAPPPAEDQLPDQAQIAPPVIERPSPPALVPMDQDCGWWDPCHLWMGAGT